MKPTVTLMLWGWIPFVGILFCYFNTRRAVIAAYVLAWLFLPNYTIEFSGLPEINKVTVATIGVLMGIAIFDRFCFERWKFSWMDGVALLWCATTVFASLANDLGLYDGLSAFKDAILVWFIPYGIGKLYLQDWKAAKELLWGIFLGGLLYVPFCVVEILMSPQFHNWVYGFHPHEFQQSIRGNSYRPVVFMKHGLMVGMWMMSASFAGVVLWVCGELPKRWFVSWIPGWLPVLGLILVFIACKSMASVGYFFIYTACFFAIRRLNFRIPLKLLLLAPVIYVGLQVSGHFPNKLMIAQVEAIVGGERAESFVFRIENEEILIEKAQKKRWLGWGGWGRSRIYDDDGKDISVTDSLWIIIFGQKGVLGLLAIYGLFALPTAQVLRNFAKADLKTAKITAFALVFLIIAYLNDSLLNDMRNPIYLLISGSATAWAGSLVRKWEPQIFPGIGQSCDAAFLHSSNISNQSTRYL